MSWVSMFEPGACTVSVSDSYGANEVWSGTLSRGGSSTSFDSNNGSLVVSVDADGVVSLVSPDDSATFAGGLKVKVTPQYDVSAMLTRSIGIAVPGGAYADFADSSNVDGNFNQFPPYAFATRVAIDAGTGAATPSEVDFAALADAVALLYAEEGF